MSHQQLSLNSATSPSLFANIHRTMSAENPKVEAVLRLSTAHAREDLDHRSDEELQARGNPVQNAFSSLSHHLLGEGFPRSLGRTQDQASDLMLSQEERDLSRLLQAHPSPSAFSPGSAQFSHSQTSSFSDRLSNQLSSQPGIMPSSGSGSNLSGLTSASSDEAAMQEALRLERNLQQKVKRARRKEDPVLAAIDRAQAGERKKRQMERLEGTTAGQLQLARAKESAGRRYQLLRNDPDKYKELLRRTAFNAKERRAKERILLETWPDEANVGAARSKARATFFTGASSFQSSSSFSPDLANSIPPSISAEDRAMLHRVAQHLLGD